MPEYLLAVHGPEFDLNTPPSPEILEAFAAVDAFNKDLMESGSWVFGGGLYPPSTATVVTSSGGKAVTTDGPYLESKEHLGGFWVVKADDLDAALEIARRASEACRQAVEVRPFQDE